MAAPVTRVGGSGEDGRIILGSNMTVEGAGCTVYGDHNSVMGLDCVIHGNHNRIYGFCCIVYGEHNIAYHLSTRMIGDHNSHVEGGPPRAKRSRTGAARTSVGVTGSGNVISGAKPVRVRGSGAAQTVNRGTVITNAFGTGSVSYSLFGGLSGPGTGSASYSLLGGVSGPTTVTLVFEGDLRLDVHFERSFARLVQADDSTRVEWLDHDMRVTRTYSTRVEWLDHDMRATRTSLRVDGREIPLHRVFSHTAADAAALRRPENVRMSDAALLELAKPEEEEKEKEEEAKDELLGEDEAVPEDGDDEACVICIENRPKVLARPCNHLVLCLHCARGLRDRTCSICRKPIETLIGVFK